jgi:sec-independent protein translocase protein TatA
MGELFQPTHLLLVAIIAMIFLGPKKLPELGKGLGEGIRGFRDSLKPAPEPSKDGGDEPKKQIE